MSFSSSWAHMREQGVSTVEIATMAGLWVPNFLMPFAYYRAFKKGAQHWTELSRMLNHLPFALSRGTEEEILILQQNYTHTHRTLNIPSITSGVIDSHFSITVKRTALVVLIGEGFCAAYVTAQYLASGPLVHSRTLLIAGMVIEWFSLQITFFSALTLTAFVSVCFVMQIVRLILDEFANLIRGEFLYSSCRKL